MIANMDEPQKDCGKLLENQQNWQTTSVFLPSAGAFYRKKLILIAGAVTDCYNDRRKSWEVSYMDDSKQLTKNISVEDVIGVAIKLPVVKVDRDEFLAQQFADTENVEDIVVHGPVEAGISREEIADRVNKLILKRTSQSSVASFVAGIPGGLAMAATIPADVAQFFGMALRLAQELSYMYGAQDLWVNGKIDDERVKSQLILYCGVMFGVSGAVSGVRVLSTQLAKTAIKKIPQKALTKTFWYPIVKQLGKVLSIKVTKTTVANGVSKAIPVVGGVISGGLNFASMMPMAKRLYHALDKAAFDYSDDEYESDLQTIEQMANGETAITSAPSDKKEEIKEKVTGTIKNVGAGVSGLIGKLGKKAAQPKEDPVTQIKQYKELLDAGILTQEEFDRKKKEILGL